MNRSFRRTLWMLAAIAALLPVVAGAETLEDAKASSGLRFGEAAGMPSAPAGAVDGARALSGRDGAGFAVGALRQRSSMKLVPPPPATASRSEKAGFRLGDALGWAATGAAAVMAPSLAALWVLGSALMGGAYAAFRASGEQGVRGRDMLKAGARGAVSSGASAVSVLADLGAAAGTLIGRAINWVAHR